MSRVRRVDVGGEIYHAVNPANFRSRLFRTDAHYEDFLGIVEEALAFVPMRILAYCRMPNHWHLVLHPRADGDWARFLQRLTMTHTQRYHARTRTGGYGHLYQGRYQSLPVESDGHFLAWVRYVERGRIASGWTNRRGDGVARTCPVGPRLLVVVGGRTADLKNRSALLARSVAGARSAGLSEVP